MFSHHGIEYLQCGQCDGGVTMLMPSGSRWMQTFRKLPTMPPNTKNTSDQNWNGTGRPRFGVKDGFNTHRTIQKPPSL